MANIPYKVVGCSNPSGQTGVEYACDRATSYGVLTLDDFAKLISDATTVTQAEVKGILSDMFEYITDNIKQGVAIKYDGFGTFTPTLKSRCFRQTAIQAQGFNPQGYITRKGVRFRIDPEFKKRFKLGAQWKRVPSELMA